MPQVRPFPLFHRLGILQASWSPFDSWGGDKSETSEVLYNGQAQIHPYGVVGHLTGMMIVANNSTQHGIGLDEISNNLMHKQIKP